jgi:hypothetical protein
VTFSCEYSRCEIIGVLHKRIILYFCILLHCIVQWVLQVMFPSAWSFIMLVFTVFHYTLRPTWPSSGFVRYFYFRMSEGFCFAAFFGLFFWGLFFTWSHSARFHLGFSCAVFLRYFCSFLACVFVCLHTSKHPILSSLSVFLSLSIRVFRLKVSSLSLHH